MYDHKPQNAIAAIRVSTTRQGTQGDSPEAQKEQIEQYARVRNIKIKKFFLFLESASKEQQPMQEAIDYCKDPKHKIELFIIKSIDRFTRGGSYLYGGLKKQLDDSSVQLLDIYGIIGVKKINTLEHLGVSYKWSVYDPTKNSEILEAERASDEKRDIMSRMIGAEIRYVRLGYWVRKAPLGYTNVMAETIHGKRSLLEPHPTQAIWFLKMFELRCRGTLDDKQIVDEVNRLGFKSRTSYIHNPHDRTRIMSKRGGAKLTVKRLQCLIRNPIYAGVNTEKWLMGQPIRCRFDGLVSIEVFNKANRGKLTITDNNGQIEIHTARTIQMGQKGVYNALYPYKRVVLCPICARSLFGSASRGKNGKQYPAYHCSGRGDRQPSHYFRIPKPKFDTTIADFVQSIRVAPRYVESVIQAVLMQWEKRSYELGRDTRVEKVQLRELQIQAQSVADKIKFFSSEITLGYLEKDLLRIEAQIAELSNGKVGIEEKATINAGVVMQYTQYFAEHPESLLFEQSDPSQCANYFGLLFEKTPTYDELDVAVKDGATTEGLSPLFHRVQAS